MGDALYAPAREIAEGVFWLGGCAVWVADNGETLHGQSSAFLIVGEEQALLFDTGPHVYWEQLSAELDTLLGGRDIDWVVPSHAELPHSGCLAALAAKYPAAVVIGDVRDYHLFYPEIEDRLRPMAVGETIDLGGREFTLVDAVLKDLPNSVWGYEASNGVLFVSDGFQYLHHPSEENALHAPGECRTLLSELPAPPTMAQCELSIRGGLAWTGLAESTYLYRAMGALMERYPTQIIAPTHGNVIDEVEAILPMLKMVYGAGPG